jgi:hypothetical protein
LPGLTNTEVIDSAKVMRAASESGLGQTAAFGLQVSPAARGVELCKNVSSDSRHCFENR